MPDPSARQKILVFDSGLGGLTVFREIRKARPDADYLYLGDDALFPYGALAPDALVARVEKVIAEAMADFPADCIVIACHTASTLVLPPLRARYSIPIVGTVPAIKPAAKLTKSGIVSVLATPGTVSRDYTAELVRDFASGIDVTLVGSKHLAEYAEAVMRGEKVDDEEIAIEIAPAFAENEGRRTDVIVLACTHYPLLLDRLEKLAPWPVTWIDPAPAIARRVVQVMGEGDGRADGAFNIKMTAGVPSDLKLMLVLEAEALGLKSGDLPDFLASWPLANLCEKLHSREIDGAELDRELLQGLRTHLKGFPASEIIPVLDRVARMPDVPEGREAETFWALVSRLQSETGEDVFAVMEHWTHSALPEQRSTGILVLAEYAFLNQEMGSYTLPFRDKTVPHINRLLCDSDPDVIDAALSAASHHRAGDLQLIGHHGNSSSADRRWKVVLALSQRDEPEAHSRLIALSTDPEPLVRDWATFGLGSQTEADTHEICEALAARLTDSDDDTRHEAIVGLAHRKDDRAPPAIVKELAGNRLSSNLLEAIGEMPDRGLLPALERLRTQGDIDDYMQERLQTAIEACRQDKPMPVGLDPAQSLL